MILAVIRTTEEEIIKPCRTEQEAYRFLVSRYSILTRYAKALLRRENVFISDSGDYIAILNLNISIDSCCELCTEQDCNYCNLH